MKPNPNHLQFIHESDTQIPRFWIILLFAGFLLVTVSLTVDAKTLSQGYATVAQMVQSSVASIKALI